MSATSNSLLEQVRTKEAARRGMKELRNLLTAAGGAINEHPLTRRLVQAATMGRDLGATGSQVRVLGSGSEGVAQLVADPLRKGLSVVKTHDPSAPLFNPALLANKDRMLGKDIPGVAKLFDRVTARGAVAGRAAPQYVGEFVGGKTPTPAEFDALRGRGLRARLGVAMQHHVPGVTLSDIHRTNFKYDASGRPKAIDFMAVDAKDMLPVAQRGLPNVVNQNIRMGSPTFMRFNLDDPASLANQVLPEGVRHGLYGQRSPEARATLRQANQRYQATLLGQAYGRPGAQPQPVQLARPAATPAPRRPAPVPAAATVARAPTLVDDRGVGSFATVPSAPRPNAAVPPSVPTAPESQPPTLLGRLRPAAR